jgi:hypothetical protein
MQAGFSHNPVFNAIVVVLLDAGSCQQAGPRQKWVGVEV